MLVILEDNPERAERFASVLRALAELKKKLEGETDG
jgi:hypothetical protein